MKVPAKIGAPNFPSNKTSPDPQAPVKVKGFNRISNLGSYAHPAKKKGKKK